MKRNVLFALFLVWSMACAVAQVFPFSFHVSANPPATTAFITNATPGGDSRSGSFWVGCRITTGGAGLTIDQLGRWGVAGNSQNHLVRIYRVSDNAIMASATITASGASWVYASASGTLAASTQYYLVSDETAGLENWGDAFVGGSLQTRSHTAVATIDGLVYSSNGTSWNFSSASDGSYVPANFK